MEPTIKVGKPPNFMKIVQAFPKAANAGTIFAYDDTIYVSDPTLLLPQSLIKHEKVHLARQKEIGVDVWWEKYCEDKMFRYKEELLAHQAEYFALIRNEPDKKIRNQRLRFVAKRLTMPLYKFDVSIDQAMADILGIKA